MTGESAMLRDRAKIKERRLMDRGGIGVSAGRCQVNAASPRDLTSRSPRRRLNPPAATLDDALRVAKNFRMSDHRPPELDNSHETSPVVQHFCLPPPVQPCPRGPVLQRLRGGRRRRQRLCANLGFRQGGPASPAGLRRRRQDQLPRPDLRRDEGDARLARSAQSVHGPERLQGHAGRHAKPLQWPRHRGRGQRWAAYCHYADGGHAGRQSGDPLG